MILVVVVIDLAEVEVLIYCFYMQVGLKEGHPILSVRWPLTPMPEPEIGKVYGRLVFNLGSTNTVLIRDCGKNIVVDPGIIQLGRYGALTARLAEVGLTPRDVDIVVNTHCHYDHVESNYLFRGKRLIIHEKELDYCRELYWPEYADAFMNILDVNAITEDTTLTENVRVIETTGHTPGSVSVVADTPEGVVAMVGDAVIVKEDLLEMRPPSVVTRNVSPEDALESLRRIASLHPMLVIPGHDAPFTPHPNPEPQHTQRRYA
ncbi:MAG: N-acyl homoserine lactonase family protein [Candidatus Bathyarchaeia archaeon]